MVKAGLALLETGYEAEYHLLFPPDTLGVNVLPDETVSVTKAAVRRAWRSHFTQDVDVGQRPDLVCQALRRLWGLSS